MGFLDFLWPKWKHSDASVRRAAVKQLEDPKLIAKIATIAADEDVRLEAVKKITSLPLLAKIARADNSAAVRSEAVKAIFNNKPIEDRNQEWVQEQTINMLADQALLAEIAKHNPFAKVRRLAVEKIADQNHLCEIAQKDTCSDVRRSAIMTITDQSLLAEIARNAQCLKVRIAAANKLVDFELAQALYVDILHAAKTRDDSVAAVGKITDQPLLREIALSHSDQIVRLAALKRLTSQDITIFLAILQSELERADTNEDVCMFAALQVPKALLTGIVCSRPSGKKKLADILDRYRHCNLCGEPVDSEWVDHKGRCGLCSGAS